jgi:hypothetical protein
MFKVDPEQRISLKDIKSSKWYNDSLPSHSDVINEMKARVKYMAKTKRSSKVLV